MLGGCASRPGSDLPIPLNAAAPFERDRPCCCPAEITIWFESRRENRYGLGPQGRSPEDVSEGKKLSEILAEEFEAIKGKDEVAQKKAAAQERAPDRYQPNGEETPEQKEQRERSLIYDVAYQLDLNALCLSGGGIRSAAISLGVIQGLVDKGLLKQFHYLSTVSGGGYIGSWLSAWLHHTTNADKVLNELGSLRRNSDQEPPPLRHLREYSNYLTPKVGLFSADTWTALSIVLRNMAVNFWLILAPTLALLVIGIKLLALFVSWEADQFAGHRALISLISLGCIAAGAVAFGYKLGRLYIPSYGEPTTAAEKARAQADPEGEPERVPKGSLADSEVPTQAQRRFLLWSLAPAIIAGFCFVWLAVQDTTPALGLLQCLTGVDWANSFLAVLLSAILVFGGAIVMASVWRKRLGVLRIPRTKVRELMWDFVSWIGAVIVFAGLVWAGAKAIHSLPNDLHLYTAQICDVVTTPCPDKNSHALPINIRHETLTVVFGLPWYLAATMCAHFTYVLLYNRSPKGEIEREWLGRASGWHFIAALAWVILSAIVLIGPAIFYNLRTTLGLLLIASGAVNWVLGKSSVTPAKGVATDWKGLAANIALAVSGPLFAALLLIVLAMAIDWAIIGWNGQCFPTDVAWGNDCRNWWWILPCGITTVLLLAGNSIININAFSLHAVYRNRLVRCFRRGARAAPAFRGLHRLRLGRRPSRCQPVEANDTTEGPRLASVPRHQYDA
jgi:hypothetical protein